MKTYAVVPGYYLVCYNSLLPLEEYDLAVVPGYYLVCYNFNNNKVARHLL